MEGLGIAMGGLGGLKIQGKPKKTPQNPGFGGFGFGLGGAGEGGLGWSSGLVGADGFGGLLKGDISAFKSSLWQ